MGASVGESEQQVAIEILVEPARGVVEGMWLGPGRGKSGQER